MDTLIFTLLISSKVKYFFHYDTRFVEAFEVLFPKVHVSDRAKVNYTGKWQDYAIVTTFTNSDDYKNNVDVCVFTVI